MVLVLVPSMQILSKIESILVLGHSLNLYRAINFSFLNVTKSNNRQISILWKNQNLKKGPSIAIIQKLKKIERFSSKSWQKD
jgi:hypothetical protein